MSNEPVVAGDASLGDSAIDQSLEGVASGDWGNSAGEGAEDAHSHGLVVVSRSVGTLTVPAPALVGTAIVTHAPVVADISPAVGVHVEVLDVTHLGGAGSLVGARLSSGVVDHDEWCGATGQQRRGSGTGSPRSAGHNRGTS